MRVRILGSSTDDSPRGQYLSTYLINDTVSIDAGCLGFHGLPRDQEEVRHVFLTHSHADHIASLPIFIENAWTGSGECPRVYGTPETLDDVQRHVFNDVVWPDFVALSKRMPPFLSLGPLELEVPVEADGLQITPVAVNHVVPTVGYIVSDGVSSVIFGGDSGPTSRIWEIAHKTPGLRAVFLEACFPNALRKLAEVSLHLTPEMFQQEVAKMPAGVKVVAVHLKVRHCTEVIRELSALEIPNMEIGECGKDYCF